MSLGTARRPLRRLGAGVVSMALGCAAGHAEDAPIAATAARSSTPLSAIAQRSTATPTEEPAHSAALPASSVMPDLPSPFACSAMNREVATFAEAPSAKLLATNGDALFWSDGRTVNSVSSAGERKRIVATGGAPIVDLVAFEADIFVIRRGSESWCNGSVERFDASDGGRRELITTRCVDRLAASSSHLAWIGPEKLPGGLEETRATLRGREHGAATRVLSRSLHATAALALTSDRLVVVWPAGRVESALLSNPDRFAPSSGRAPVRFEFGGFDQRLLAVDASFAYFYGSGTRKGGLRVFRAPLDGQATETIGSYADLDAPGAPSRSWAESPTHLHFTLPSAGRVFRADKSGRCGVELLASGRQRPDAPAIVGDSLFWLELGSKPITIARMRL